MALTPSTMMSLGTRAPDFILPDAVSGQNKSLADVAGAKGTLVMFICNHCPFVQHVEGELVALGNDYITQGIGIVAINANDIEQYPEDGPEAMAARAEQKGYPFPYLFDDSQAVAKAYDAACTPDFFLFDDTLSCVYRGQLDASRPGNPVPVTGGDLRAAMRALINGEAVSIEQRPSTGCNIKWKQ